MLHVERERAHGAFERPDSGAQVPVVLEVEARDLRQDSIVLVDPQVELQSAAVEHGQVALAGPSTATWVSWKGHEFDGPWIMNANGVGALTFFAFPITP